MKLKALYMAPDRHARLKAMAKERGFTSTARFVEKLIAEAYTRREVVIPVESKEQIDAEVERRMETYSAGNTLHTIEDCARALINTLPEATKAFAYEICERILRIEPSQLIHGHLMNAADAGQLQAPHIDPSWEQAKMQYDRGQSICEWCHQPFTPGYVSQRYCGPICGGMAATAVLPQSKPATQPILEAPGMQNLIAV